MRYVPPEQGKFNVVIAEAFREPLMHALSFAQVYVLFTEPLFQIYTLCIVFHSGWN